MNLQSDNSKMQLTLQSIFQMHFAQYERDHKVSGRAWRAAQGILKCRTSELGGRVLECPGGHTRQTQFFSCRHRSCPRCNQRPQQEWAAAQVQRLLPCEHFHVVFTLPHEFLTLWAYNRSVLANVLFQCARDTLMVLCADPKHLGVVPGIVMALHTWGRTLNHHPHVHCLVSAGGIAPDEQWRDARKGFLLPVEVVKRLFRGKLLHALSSRLREHRLQLPPEQPLAHWMACIRAQWRKNFNVRLAEPYPYGDGVVRYLARYVKGGPINERSLREAGHQQVAFTYTDHRDGQRKLMRLQPNEFIDRVLWHAPPRGQHTVRHYGLYATASRHLRSQCAKQITGHRLPVPPPLFSATSCITLHPQCPICHIALNVVDTLEPAHRRGEVSSHTPPSQRLCPTPRSNGHATRAFNPPVRPATRRAPFFRPGVPIS